MLLLVLLICWLACAPLCDAQKPPECPPPYQAQAQSAAEKKVAELERSNPNSFEMIRALQTLAHGQRLQDPKKCVDALKRALAIRESLPQRQGDISAAELMVEIADAYELIGDYRMAMTYLQSAEDLCKREPTTKSAATAINALYHHASCLLSDKPGDPAEAENKARQCLSWSEKMYGAQSAHACRALEMLYLAYIKTGQRGEAQLTLMRSQRLLKKLKGPSVGVGTANPDLESLLRAEESDE
jgi:tetratricopeptide (TPR) repeat protein